MRKESMKEIIEELSSIDDKGKEMFAILAEAFAAGYVAGKHSMSEEKEKVN